MKFLPQYLILLFLGAWLFACKNPSEITYDIAFQDQHIAFTGRFIAGNNNTPRVWNPGACMSFDFEGKDCEIMLVDENKFYSQHNYVTIVIDNEVPQRMRLNKELNSIHLQPKSKNTHHHISIYKATESGIGYIELKSIRCKKLLLAPKKKASVIEFIGDSITCGTGSETSEIACGEGSWYDQHDAYHTYALRVTRTFKKRGRLCAVSGIGMATSCCGNDKVMPEIYDLTDFSSPDLRWTEKEQPELVMITLGQNDGKAKPKAYVENYVRFVQHIRHLYPKAPIVLCSSPMGDEKLKPYQAEKLPLIQDLLHEKGVYNTKVFLYKGSYRSGCDKHPTVKEHERIAKELEVFLRKEQLLN